MASTIPTPSTSVPRKRPSTRKLVATGVRELAPVIVTLLFLFPFIVMISTSFKSPNETFSIPPRIWSDHWILDNYRRVFEVMPFWRYVGNTLLLSILAVIGTLFSCPLVAYSLSKVPWKLRDPLFLVIISTMMLPPQVTMIPVYLLWNETPLMGTWWPLIIPNFLGSAFSIFLLRQFFRGIPNDLLDAARIDGASEARIYWDIVLPLARPALATVGLFAFVGTWTDFLNPLIYLNDPKLYTLSIGLYNFFSEHGVEWGPLMAACVIFSIPLVMVFIIAQRHFIEGISLTGLK
ncbi:MAG: carbohydrate ABC transporter permease [Thermomicrobiales bacterium]